ncbi:MAG: lipid A phosphoethanolamine transferase [Flavobacteriaceae bacterium]|jgi:glucan phosphoethanolaminetransferase (alkaline phosphatase superfamily)|nr:lipid A phosphoethanolamine transferase [Flavobacteriaceae bacterium]
MFKNKTSFFLLIAATLLYLTGFYFSYSNLFEGFFRMEDFSVVRNLFEYGIMYASLLVFCSMLYRKKYLRFLPYILLFIISLNFLISAICRIVYHSSFNSGMVLSVIDSNVDEALSMSTMFIVPIIICLLFWAFNIYVVKTVSRNPANKFLVLFSLLWVVFPILFKLKQNYISNKGGAPMIKSVLYHYNDFEAGIKMQKDLAKIKKNKIKLNAEKTGKGINTIVLLIGESVVPKHMQLYGYSIKNTMFQNGEIPNMQLYENAVSPAGITNLSVPLMLSTIKPEKFTSNKEEMADNIINFANQNGYETYWISTQTLSGSVTAIASYSKNIKYVNGYDEVAIPVFNQALKNKKNKLIILHLIGSHPNPCDKIPDAEKVFDENNPFNCYDSSINYTDKIISKILNPLKNEDAVFIYAADHGLKIIDGKYLHTDSKESVKVPFYIWFSPKTKEYANKGIVKETTQTTIIYPKIIEFMGYEPPKNYKNKDLKYLDFGLKTIDYSDLGD